MLGGIKLEVKIKKVHKDAIAPEYKTEGAVGFDFYSTERVILKPSAVIELPSATLKPTIAHYPVEVGTGVAMELPQGYELEMRGRSGLGFKNDVHVFNGTIDYDYRGEIRVKLYNLGNETIVLEKGTRIAQGIIKPVVQVTFDEVSDLSPTARGEKGFGSTSLK